MTTITIERELLEKVREALWQMTKQFNFGRLHESRLRDSEARVAAHDAMKALEEALSAPATAPEQCWCDEQNIGEPGVSCGDCPTRDYKHLVTAPEAWMTDESPPRTASDYTKSNMPSASAASFSIPLYRHPPATAQKPLFAELIALHEGLAEELAAMDAPSWHDAPTEVNQIAEALRQIGLMLVRTSDGYKVLKLGAITAQEDKS